MYPSYNFPAAMSSLSLVACSLTLGAARLAHIRIILKWSSHFPRPKSYGTLNLTPGPTTEMHFVSSYK